MEPMVTPPEHRARTRRWGRDEKRRGRRRRRRRGRRAGDDVEAPRERDAGFDDAAEAASSSPVKKRPRRLLSQIGEALGSLRRVGSGEVDGEIAVPVLPDPAVAAPTPSSAPVGICIPEERGVLAPEGNGVAALSLPTPAAASTTTTTTTSGLFLPPGTSLRAPPSPSSSSSQVLAPPPPPVPAAPIMRPKKRKMVPASDQPPASSSSATVPPLALLAPPQPADAFERRDFLMQRFSGLIAKSQQAVDDRYREDLKRGRAAPDQPEPVVDKETLRLRAAVAFERRRFGSWLQRTETKAKRDALFTQNARREHVRALGIDAAMEGVASPQRPRGRNGEPIVSPEHPCSPVEKLGLFLKPL